MATSAEQFLQEMQRRRALQLQQIRSMLGDNPGKGLDMPAAQTRPGLVGGTLHGITGLLGGNAAQAGLQSSGALGALSSLFGAGSQIGGMAAGTSLENPALFNSSGLLSFL